MVFLESLEIRLHHTSRHSSLLLSRSTDETKRKESNNIFSVTRSNQDVSYYPLDEMLVHHRVTPSIKFASTDLYICGERGTMTVKCFAQEHSALPWPWLERGPLNPESSTLTIRPPRLLLGDLPLKN